MRFRTGVSPMPGCTGIAPQDLEEDQRTLGLFADAVGRGLAQDSEARQPRVLALVEHARRYGTTNRPGLLRAKRQRWHFITQDDEERARRRLHRVRHGEPFGERADQAVPAASASRSFSADARFVLAAQREFARIGVRSDVLEHVRRVRPEWPEDRWAAALRELASSQTSAVTPVRSVRVVLSGVFGVNR
jgi:hypothetical protein